MALIAVRLGLDYAIHVDTAMASENDPNNIDLQVDAQGMQATVNN